MASLVTEQVPVRLAPLVGRESELQEILTALPLSRLLTLTGPGGTGKTRLALAAAAAARQWFPAGVCWVELAPLDDGTVLAREVATRLGVPENPGQDAAVGITDHVGANAVLLVLDNCEHLTAAAAELAERLLAACRALTILATSREVLGVDGERSWPVPPLSLPDASVRPAARAIAGFDAVRFFEQRAQLTLPSFRLSDQNAASVLQVCRRLDGLPLAIELAAARMRILSAQQLAERLDDIFGVLVGGTRTAPPRHQALRATLDWSHDLLDADERAVFRRLAVFAGGFTLASAERVGAGGDITPQQMLDLLTRLADKSLLHVDHSGRTARYQLLSTVREYARERLVEAGEEDDVRRAHLARMADLVGEIAPRIDRGGDGADGLERELDALDAETGNLRAAMELARQCNDAIAALRIAGPLGKFAYLRGHYQEVRQWMDAAVILGADAPADLRAVALLGSGRLALLQCDYQPAVRRLEAALRLYRELDDPGGIAATLQVLGSVAREQGRYARAIDLHAESLATAEAATDTWAVASAHGYLGFAAWLQRDFERATAECNLALVLARELGDTEGIAWALISLGTIARYEGNADQALALLSESRDRAERIGFREGIAWSLEQLGLLAIERGDPEAGTLLRTSLDIHYQLRDRWRVCSVLVDLAALAVAEDRPDRAALLLAAAETMRAAIGTVVAPCERRQHEAAMAATRAALSEASFAAAWQRGNLAQIEDILAALEPHAAGSASAADRQAGDGRGPAAAPLAGQSEQAAVPQPATPKAGRSVPRPRQARTGTLRIRALGAATVQVGDEPVTAADWGYAKPRELLFLLATSPPMTRDQLGAALWPDQARERLGSTLHTALRGVRRALGAPDWIIYSDGRYSFNTAREHDCDVGTFEQALAAARRARPQEAALPDLQRALAAYGGEFLAGMSAGDWAQVRRDELARSFESALLATGRLHMAAGRFQPAAAAFRRAVSHEPLNETAHRELMTCWARLGETARAVRHYQELADVLQQQVGVAPAAETTALYKRLTQRS
ncbi:MAG: BTAD domain-containing putative transcriptional regulator [Streptosporangiaceae bacterium]